MWREGVWAVRRRVGYAPGGVGWPRRWARNQLGLCRGAVTSALCARRTADPRLDADTTVWTSTDAGFGWDHKFFAWGYDFSTHPLIMSRGSRPILGVHSGAGRVRLVAPHFRRSPRDNGLGRALNPQTRIVVLLRRTLGEHPATVRTQQLNEAS